MAVDTEHKRRSCLSIGFAHHQALTTVDGTIDQADRQTNAFTYSGILAGEVVATQGIVGKAPILLSNKR